MKKNLFMIHSQHSFLCEKFVNLIMFDGKKLKAYTIFFNMLNFLKKKVHTHSEKKLNSETQIIEQESLISLLIQAIENVKPSLEVKKVRVAGNTYLVPAVLSKKKQTVLGMRWLIEAARKKKKNSKLSFSFHLAEEVFEALKKQGYAYQKRDELHRLAEANRAYIRYRWW